MAKSNFLWTAINSISNGKLIPKSEFSEKQYNAFMVLKALSMDARTCPYLEPFNKKIFRDADPYFHYLALYHSIPKRYRVTKFIKGNLSEFDVDLINAICEYYQVNKQKAEEYAKVLTKEQQDYIRTLCVESGIIDAKNPTTKSTTKKKS